MASGSESDHDPPHDQMEQRPNDKGKKKVSVSLRGKRQKTTTVVVPGPWYPPPRSESDDDIPGPSTRDRPFVPPPNVESPHIDESGIRRYNIDGEVVEVTEDGRLVVKVVGDQ